MPQNRRRATAEEPRQGTLSPTGRFPSRWKSAATPKRQRSKALNRPQKTSGLLRAFGRSKKRRWNRGGRPPRPRHRSRRRPGKTYRHFRREERRRRWSRSANSARYRSKPMVTVSSSAVESAIQQASKRCASRIRAQTKSCKFPDFNDQYVSFAQG